MAMIRRIRRRLFPRGGHIIVLHRQQAIYFAIPKVANSSVKDVCARLLGAQDGASQIDFELNKKSFNNSNMRAILKDKQIMIEQKDLKRYRHYWKFGFVRNPWDRLVSCYVQMVDKPWKKARHLSEGLASMGVFHPGMSFDAFALAVSQIHDSEANRHFRSQHLYVTNWRKRMFLDYVGRFENFESDCRFAFSNIGADGIELPHLLKSTRQSYQDYYTSKLKDMVARRYRRDIDLFGYEF